MVVRVMVVLPVRAGTVPLMGLNVNDELAPLVSVAVHAKAWLPVLLIVSVLLEACVPQFTRPLVPKKTSPVDSERLPLVPCPVMGIASIDTPHVASTTPIAALLAEGAIFEAVKPACSPITRSPAARLKPIGEPTSHCSENCESAGWVRLTVADRLPMLVSVSGNAGACVFTGSTPNEATDGVSVNVTPVAFAVSGSSFRPAASLVVSVSTP